MNLAIQIMVDALLLASLWIIAKQRVAAMALLIAGQSVLLVYLLTIGQLGFWPWNVGMIAVAGRNWWLWSRDRQRV